jgi:hypothetical protein
VPKPSALEVDDEALDNNSTNHNTSAIIIRSVATRLAVAQCDESGKDCIECQTARCCDVKGVGSCFRTNFCFLFDLARLYRTRSCRCRGCLGSHLCHRPTLRPPAATTCSPTMRLAFSSRILAMSAVNIAKWCLSALSTGRTAALSRTPWATSNGIRLARYCRSSKKMCSDLLPVARMLQRRPIRGNNACDDCEPCSPSHFLTWVGVVLFCGKVRAAAESSIKAEKATCQTQQSSNF